MRTNDLQKKISGQSGHFDFTESTSEIRAPTELHSMSYPLADCSLRNLFKKSYILITVRKRSLGQGNVFTGVCLSMGGWLPSIHHRSQVWRVCNTPGCRRPPTTTGKVGGMHPTGMLPCFTIKLGNESLTTWLVQGRRFSIHNAFKCKNSNSN